MDLFLHIGTEKTGTQTIQKFLYDNIDKFKEKKIHLSKLIQFPNNRHLAEMFADYSIFKKDYDIPNKFFTAQDKKIFFGNLKIFFENEIEQTKLFADKMIITSEHFHSQLKNINQIKSLKNFLAKFFNKIKIICYLREQSELAISWYSTVLKGSEVIEFDNFIKKRVRIDNHYFNYYEFLKKWSEVFGKENIIPIIFDFKEKDNKQLITNFLDKIDPDLKNFINVNSSNRFNLSIHPQLWKYVQLLNLAKKKIGGENIQQNPKIGFSTNVAEIKKLIINISKSLRAYDANYELKIEIYKKFNDINIKFFYEFFKKKENLFKLPIKQTVLSQQKILENEKKILLNFFSLILRKKERVNDKSLELKKTKPRSTVAPDIRLSKTPVILTISDIYTFYEKNFNTKLKLEIYLLKVSLPDLHCIVSKDMDKLTIGVNFTGRTNLMRLVSIIKICEFTKYFKNALFFLGDGGEGGDRLINLNQRKIAFCSNKKNTILIPDYNFTLKYFEVLSNLENLPEIKSNLSIFCCGSGGLQENRDRFNFFNFAFENEDILKLYLRKTSAVKDFLKKFNVENFKKFFPRDRDFFKISKNTPFNKISLRGMYFFLVQVDVDGETNSFPGFFHKLYSGRPLLKIRSSLGYRQWYYDRLTPDFHYFDVKSDLSNFREKYYQALEQSKTTKVFPGREFICKMNYDEELKLAADKISFYFK